MKRFKFGHLVAVLVGLALPALMQAKDVAVKSEEKLVRVARKNELSVVLFYEEGKAMRHDRELKSQLNNLRADFNMVSRNLRYKDAEIRFVTANIVKGDLQGVLQDLGAQQVPVLVLYRNGSVLRDASNKVLMLNGFVSQGEMKKFIDDNLNKDIDEILDDKAERRRERLEEDRIRALYYGPGFYSPWYYGYGYPYGYGYGWPYRRWGYPYGGIGFGFGVGI